MKPKIALLSRINDERYTLNQAYYDGLTNAGADCIILTPMPTENLHIFLEQCDGLLVPGGNDVNPKIYDEMNDGSYPIEDEIETLDLEAIHYMFENKKPIFGICRGLQIINVAFGGTLYQDLPTQTNTYLDHNYSLNNKAPMNGHWIDVDVNSHLYTMLGSRIEVNSYHHQGIKDLAPNLKASAYANDGLVEALETEGILAVQWHPERMTSLPQFQALFNDFVSKCRK
ncbi:MAG: gamma-glutamyl-gamma-aminobutyrate hydrolase family protein [Bacilli bacterium]|nr:gamma-glutamyl-gamma-aminobutyrate hydrolase family protein [Bacilli bacterium]